MLFDDSAEPFEAEMRATRMAIEVGNTLFFEKDLEVNSGPPEERVFAAPGNDAVSFALMKYPGYEHRNWEMRLRIEKMVFRLVQGRSPRECVSKLSTALKETQLFQEWFK